MTLNFCCAGAQGLHGPVDVQLLELAGQDEGSEDEDEGSEDELSQDDAIEEEEEEEEEAVTTEDKETNTECVFIPEKGTRKKSNESTRAKIIKRSQTFSPSAAVNKNQYICRVSIESAE